MTEADVIQPSASIASPGLGIRYIGKDRCYGFSGSFPASTTAAAMFSFTSGSGYAVVELQCNGFIKLANIGGGALGAWEVKFNDITVAILKVTGSDETSPYTITQNMIIPPFTKVAVEVTSTSNDAAFLTTAVITGRVYGAT